MGIEGIMQSEISQIKTDSVVSLLWESEKQNSEGEIRFVVLRGCVCVCVCVKELQEHGQELEDK